MSLMRKSLAKLEPVLVSAYRKLLQAPPPNLEGDRYIEYSWIAAHMPAGPGRALDFGCGYSWMGLLAARRGFTVTAVDLRAIDWSYSMPALRFRQGDLFDLLPDVSPADLVICCSTIEHVGLSDRYEGGDRSGSDLEAMQALHRALAPAGLMLLTLPVGRDAEIKPYHRVYGERRLPELLRGFTVDASEFWAKDAGNRWQQMPEATVLNEVPSATYYGLGLFKLRKQP